MIAVNTRMDYSETSTKTSVAEKMQFNSNHQNTRMDYSETSTKTSVADKMQFNSNHQDFHPMGHSAVPTNRSQPPNQNVDLPVYRDPFPHRMQCCLCHSRYSSSQDLYRHYVEYHSPHELSLALLQQQCLPSVSTTMPSGVTMAPVENSDQRASSARYWSDVEDDTSTISFSGPPKPDLSGPCQENMFSIPRDSCSLAGDYRRGIDGLSLVETVDPPCRDFDVSLPHCTGSLECLAKCLQKPTPQKIMSQMMGMAGEDDGDDWPDLGDDITLIDDEDLLSSLDLFPNLLDFVIELDAKEESGTLTVQTQDLQHCPQKHLGYPDQHGSYQGAGLLQYIIPSREKRIDALQRKSIHECGSHSAFCSDDSAPLTHSFILSHKDFHNVSGVKTMSVDGTFDNTRQFVTSNTLLEAVNGDHDAYKQLISNEHGTSSHVTVNNHKTFMHDVSNIYAQSQQDISNEDSSLPNESVHFDASGECVERRPIVDPSSLSDPRGLPLNYNDPKSPALTVDCDATVAANIMNGKNVINKLPIKKNCLVNETASANHKELSPFSQTRDLLPSGMTVPPSIEIKIANCAEPRNMSEERLPYFNERVHSDYGPSFHRVAPRFITTQAPTQKHYLDSSLCAVNYDTAGSTRLSVQTSIPSGASVQDVSNELKPNCGAYNIPSSIIPKTKPQFSKLSRSVRRRRSQVQIERPQNHLKASTCKPGNSLVGLCHPACSKKSKVVKPSSVRVVKCKQSDDFIYEKGEMDVFSNTRLSAGSKFSSSKCNPIGSLKLTKAMMGTIELRNFASELTEKSTNEYSFASVIRLPVYTDPDSELAHTPKLVNKEGCTISSTETPSFRQRSSFSIADSRSQDARRQQFLCHLCWEQFQVMSALTVHLKAEHAEWVTCFACRCGSTFASEDAFRIHWRVKHRDFFQITYTCRVCGQTFRRENSFNAHLRVIHPDYKMVCYVCEKRFVNMKSLRVHMAVHTKKQIFACPYCPKSYILRYSFNRHFVNHFSNPWCHSCNKRFKSKQSYDDHMRRHRVSQSLGRASTLKCNNCGDLHEGSSVSCNRDSGLGHHKVCISCNKGLYKMFNLANESHEPSNTTARVGTPSPESLSRGRQECPQCQSWVLDLAKHVRRVHRQPTVPCDVCGALVKKECLPAHKDRAHARLGGVPCDHCNKLFANALSLREHINRVKNKIKSVLVDII